MLPPHPESAALVPAPQPAWVLLSGLLLALLAFVALTLRSLPDSGPADSGPSIQSAAV